MGKGWAEALKESVYSTPQEVYSLAASLWTVYIRSTPCILSKTFRITDKDVEAMLTLLEVARVAKTGTCEECAEWAEECALWWGMSKDDTCPDFHK